MPEIVFHSSARPTIGVELELQILDRESLGFKNVAPDVLKAVTSDFNLKLKEEFIESMIEINTGICNDVKEAEGDLRESLSYLERLLESFDAVFYSASLHPFEHGTDRNLTKKARYERIMNDLQLVGRRFITQGMHVHIGMESPELALRVNNTIRMYLPLLLALSTSSPYYAGEDTGLFSYRTKLFEALPLAGLPDSIEGWDEFVRMAELLMAGGIIDSVKDLWWDVRPHPGFGTVEVRICDIPGRFSEIVALVALIQALVVTVSRIHVHPEARIQMQILRSNKWQAARYGLDGVFVNPVAATRMPIREAVKEMLELVSPRAAELGGLRYLGVIYEILDNGTGAHAQRRIYSGSGDFRHMIAEMRERFYA